MKKLFLECLSAKRFGQAILIIALGMGVVVLTIAAIDHQVIHPAFRQLEWKQALEDSDRALAAIENEVAGLVKLANDWAYWDDAYDFTQDHDPAFIKANYPDPATLSEASSIDVLAFYDREGACLLQGVFQPSMGEKVQLELLKGPSPPVLALVAPVMNHDARMEGILDTEYGLLLLVVRPILTSSKNGPSRGVLLMGRFFNESGIKALAHRTKGEVRLLGRQALSPVEHEIFDQMAARASQEEVQPVAREGFMYRMVSDIEKQPLVLLRTPVRGEIWDLCEHTGRILLSVLSAISLVLLFCLVLYRCRMKTANRALEVSEARYRQLFEAESDAIFLFENHSGRILEANRAAINLYGYDHNELLAKKHADLLAEPGETQGETLQTLLNENRHPSLYCVHRKKDGAVFPVEITGSCFEDQQQSMVIVAVRDISERKRVEERLHLTQFAVEHSSDSATWLNPEGKFLYANGSACRLLGYTREELEEMSIFDLYPGLSRDTWSEQWQMLKTKKHMFLEATPTTRDGREIPVEISRNFIESDGREYNCAFVRDLRERKRMEREKAELEALNWQLQKEESLGRMAAAIAHHFNNQLTVMRGHIELLMYAPVVERTSAHLAAALQGADRATELNDLMLTYLGQSQAKRQPLDLAELCHNFLPMLRATLPDSVVLKSGFPVPGPVVILSMEQMQQILINLTTNSAEALGANPGTIEIDLRIVGAADIPSVHRFPVGWKPRDQDYARLSVTDGGCGIAPEDIEKLFDPFFTSKFTGRGLGLAVVLGLTKAHEGAITVESEPGQGSTFRIYLPLSDQAGDGP